MLQPTRLISTPFAQEGDKTEIQNVTGEFDNSATYRLGFPPLTMQSIRLGGKPPKGTDFNGVLFDVTENISFLCKGGRYQYNAGLSTLIGGYPEGSNLLLDDNVTEVVSTVAGNQNNPNTDMTGWTFKPNRTTAANVADASGETQQQVNYNGGAKWHSRVGGYLENERVILTNGDIVKSTVDGNLNDPNVDMTGWVKTNSASQIFDASGETQQFVNDGVDSIAQLRTINPKRKGIRLYLNSAIAGKNLGGGMFVSTQKVGLVDNGGTIIASPDPALFWVRINYENVIPQFWGALGDIVNDDRSAFQSAVNYLHSIGGGELLVPKPVSGYRWKSYDSVESACLVIPSPLRSTYVDPITIRGAGNLIDIKVNLPLGASILSAVLYKGGGLYNKIENLSIWGGATPTTPQCDYVVKASDAYYPNMTIRDCQFYVAKEDCLKLSTYVTVLDKVQTAYSKRGIVVNKIDSMVESGASAPVTSITLNSCYALEHTHNGYWFGEATYCVFNACAADHIINTTADGYEAYPYYIDIARGVTFNAMGAESSTRILRVRAAQGLVINGIMTLSIGDSTTPPNSLIYIEGGESTTIAGFWKQNPKGFQNVLRVGNTFGREAIVVQDESIKSTECTWVANSGHERPIRFVCEDFTVKTHDLPVTNTGNATTNASNLSAWFALNYSREYLHDLIIRLPSGDFPISAKSYLVDKFNRGYGRIRLIGHADGTSRIVTTGDGGLVMGVPNKLAPTYVTLENATIHMQPPNGATKGLELYNSVLTLINGKITSDNGARQYYSNNSSKIILDSASQITTAYTGSVNVEYNFKATAAPTTSTRLPVGTIFRASDPNATRIGWINTVDNGSTWLAMTP